jgi:transmembrane 9 superfamily protein 2/4
MGFSEVSNNNESILLRNYRMQNMKKTGFWHKRDASMSEILYPDVSPEEYLPGDRIQILVDQIESHKTSIPFGYYDLPGCPYPEMKKIPRTYNNLGSTLQGHNILPAPFEFIVKKDTACTPLCQVTLERKKLRRLKKIIEHQYRGHMKLDGLPVLMRSSELNYAVRGFPVGFRIPIRGHSGGFDVFLYNHLKFAVTYHEDPSLFDGIRITGFDVHPVSIAHDISAGDSTVSDLMNTAYSTCSGMDVHNEVRTYLSLSVEKGDSVDVVYSYDVSWIESDKLMWADRWDVYLVGAPDGDDIHYYSIASHIFLMVVLAASLVYCLRMDLRRYEKSQKEGESQEETTGWKAVQGDVFRPPSEHPMVLSVMVGTGMQIGVSFGLAILLAVCQFTNPLRSGEVLTSMIVLYALCGLVGGYWSSRVYQLCGGSKWNSLEIATASALPGLFLGMLAFENIFLTLRGAANAIGSRTFAVLIVLWTIICLPMVVVGARLGRKLAPIAFPVEPGKIARAIPARPWSRKYGVPLLVGLFVPFLPCWSELAFVMSALWFHQLYFKMEFLLISLVTLGVVSALVGIGLCYMQLRAEDHRWWWKSFANCAMVGCSAFLYALWYLNSKLNLATFLAVKFYLICMAMISICIGLFSGSVGFLSSLWFTRTIYGSVTVA